MAPYRTDHTSGQLIMPVGRSSSPVPGAATLGAGERGGWQPCPPQAAAPAPSDGADGWAGWTMARVALQRVP